MVIRSVVEATVSCVSTIVVIFSSRAGSPAAAFSDPFPNIPYSTQVTISSSTLRSWLGQVDSQEPSNHLHCGTEALSHEITLFST